MAEQARHAGMGHALMNAAIDVCYKQAAEQDIVISAQSYLAGFYQSLGFHASGQYYLEDNIPHQRMYLLK